MHSYLKTIGFSELIKKADIDKILNEVIEKADEKKVVETKDHRIMAELSKYYGCDTGITVCGEYDEEDRFHVEYYFHFFRGSGITSRETVAVEKHGGRESYAGACDDVRAGETLFFFLQNVGDFLEQREKGIFPGPHATLTLSGLASEGKILFPVYQTEKVLADNKQKMSERNALLEAAKKGDEQAIESLTMDDIDTYARISERLVYEDLLSIVESFFIPCGIECDQYEIMGDIIDVMHTVNKRTGEMIAVLTLSCNDFIFDVCINEKDLYGTPLTGYRFKGYIWLQGRVNE